MNPKPIALTFDDGPGHYTPEVLDILHAHDQRATFFVLGERVKDRRDLVHRIVEEGHQLAYHGWVHQPAPGWEATTRQLTSAIPFRHLMAQPLYRPPWGHINFWGQLACSLLGWKLARWDIAVADWTPRSSQGLLDDLVMRLFPGAVVLLHDHHEGGSTYHATSRTSMLHMLESFFHLIRGQLVSVRWDELWP